jgi:PncC family amidohydrolase
MISSVASDLGAVLVRKGWMLATAESCTGGLVAHEITRLPGCSRWYCGGVVAYANATKTALLGVPAQVLADEGAVSGSVAAAMANGVLARLPDAQIAIGITGIAGPDGGSADKPVGLVYVALAARGGGVFVQRLLLSGVRAEIQIAAGQAALQMVYDFVRQGT